MKRLIGLGVVVGLIVLLAGPVPSEARGHFFFNFTVPLGVGPGWWGPPYPYYPYYPYYAAPPVIVQQSPPVYVQPEAPPQQPAYWYYCQNSKAYYPYVKECPGGWMTVVPPTTAPPGGPTP